MCWDKEDGGTRDLNLQLLTLSRLEVDTDNWLQFDVKNQEFVGVPLENDVGREEYQLVCSDSEGYSSIDGIEVREVFANTRPRKKNKKSRVHPISIYIHIRIKID